MVSSRIALKRVYDEPSDLDGFRVLVDRLWPRGLTKAAAHIDLWLRDLAPSNDLRKWYHAHPEHWKEFRQKYSLNCTLRQRRRLYSSSTTSSIASAPFRHLRARLALRSDSYSAPVMVHFRSR